MEIKIGEETFVVKTPTPKNINDAKMFSSIKFAELIKSGILLREELEVVVEKRGLWTEEKRNQIEQLNEKIEDNLKKLEGKLSKEKKKELAKETRSLRVIVNVLRNQQNEIFKHTVESMVDDAYFDFLVQASVFTESGEKVYKSYEDYQDRSGEELAIRAANRMAEMLFGLKENWQKELPENKFLIEQGVLDENLNVVEE